MKTIIISLVLAFVALAQQPPLRPVRVTLTSSSTDTYAGTAAPTLSAYVTGQLIMFTANAANTGAASINVDAVGALTIVKLGGGIATALADNDIRSGQQVMCQYDGTNCQMLSQLGNAASGSGGGAAILAAAWETSGMAQGLTRYTAPWYDQGNATEAVRQFVIPRNGTLSDLCVKTISTGIPSGQSLTATVRVNGADTALLYALAGTNTQGCELALGPVSVTAGDLISFKLVTTGGTGTIYPAVQVKYVQD